MKFKYKRYSSEILRPVIPIEIIYKNIVVPYEVLVDSGSDICIFDAQIADLLGINLKTGQEEKVAGVTGISESYYLHTIQVAVGGSKHAISAGFLQNMGRFGHGVVGQKGFFDMFIVKFDLVQEEITLQTRNILN